MTHSGKKELKSLCALYYISIDTGSVVWQDKAISRLEESAYLLESLDLNR